MVLIFLDHGNQDPSLMWTIYLVSLLSVDCQQRIIDDGKTWAVEQLNLLQPPLASSCRLYLARTFHIPEFVVPAVRELMTRSKDGKHIRAITEEEVEEMGLIAFSTIARGLEGIDVERTLMALTPPTLPQDNICKTHVKCKESWKKGWSTIIASKLVGKDSMVLSQIADSLTGMFFPSGLNFACKSKGVTKLRQGNIFQVEQVFIEKVIEIFLKAYRLDNLSIPTDSVFLNE
jgi:hypothetical protein